jgi:hypothetical protein
MPTATLPPAEELRARYKPQGFDTAEGLRLIGKRSEIHPRDAHAFLYPSREAADLFAQANRERNGVETLGTAEVEGGVVGVLDIRSFYLDHGGSPTDPALPDDWTPPRKDS